MSQDALAARRARHQPIGGDSPLCECGERFKDCDAALAFAALEEVQAAADMLDWELMDRRRACDAFRTELEQERQARQAAEARVDELERQVRRCKVEHMTDAEKLDVLRGMLNREVEKREHAEAQAAEHASAVAALADELEACRDLLRQFVDVAPNDCPWRIQHGCSVDEDGHVEACPVVQAWAVLPESTESDEARQALAEGQDG